MLWTTWPHLLQALEIMAAWGFDYSSGGFVWVKLRRGFRKDLLGILPSDISMGLGYTTRKASEPCLLGRRGSPGRLRNDVRDVILAPVREHSRKPDEFYQRVEQFAPGPFDWICSRVSVGPVGTLGATSSTSFEDAVDPSPTSWGFDCSRAALTNAEAKGALS